MRTKLGDLNPYPPRTLAYDWWNFGYAWDRLVDAVVKALKR